MMALAPRQGAHLGSEPFPDPSDRLGAGHDEQLAVGIAADVEPQEIKTRRHMDDSGLILIEGKPPGRQPFSQPSPDLFGLVTRVTERDQIVGVSHQRRSARYCLRDITAEL